MILPFPSRLLSFSGALNNAVPSMNFDNAGATDLDAAAFNQFNASGTAMVQTAAKCYLKISSSGSIIDYQPSWNAVRTVSPIFSTVSTGSTNIYQIKFGNTIIDQAGNEQVIFLSFGIGNADTNAYNALITVSVISFNTVLIYENSISGTAHAVQKDILLW